MKILVLDTIHGGAALAEALKRAGHAVDMVDVYRGREGIPAGEAARRRYDLVAAPVHLDPAHPLFCAAPRRITHHEAVRMLLVGNRPALMIEITGARGKTTTATALASVLPGPGILHTSMGTVRYPEGVTLWKRSITPASVLPAAAAAERIGGWLVAEESLGVTGAGDLAILTATGDYTIAAGKRRALAEKIRSMSGCAEVLVPPGTDLPGACAADTIAVVTGTLCRYRWKGIEGAFENPLLALPGYRTPLQMAAAAACLLGADPAALAAFAPLEGRMAVARRDGKVIVDNANSGTCRETAVGAAAYARALAGGGPLTLVIGTEGQTICEGFPADEVKRTIDDICPDRVVLVGDYPEIEGIPAGDLAEGAGIAEEIASDGGAVVLAVKTWR
jgi:hypothetical protein